MRNLNNNRFTTLKIAVIAFTLIAGALAFHSYAQPTNNYGYKTPPAPLQAIVEQQRAPTVNLSPRRDLAAMIKTPSLPSITEVAQPELKLAGLRINPRTYSQSRFSFGEDLWLFEIESRKEMRIAGLPKNLKLADIAWSPDQRNLAFTHISDVNGVELWTVNVASKQAKKISTQPLNTVYGSGFNWLPDSKGLIVRLRPANQAAAPSTIAIPQGPNTQDALPGGAQRQVRTLQDLLKNENDALIFDQYTLSQLAIIDLNGKAKNIGTPDRMLSASASPDGKLLLTQSIERPYSYIVAASSFPRRIEVRELNAAAKFVHTIAKLPLEEGLPPGNDAVRQGVRDVAWRADAPATLVWAEAQDGGDPARAADTRDTVFMHAAPFAGKPNELIKLTSRYAGAQWARGDLALVSEYWWKTRAVKTWKIVPDASVPATNKPELINSYSSEDRYNDPGSPATVMDAAGNQRLLIAADKESIFLDGEGASKDGDRPFVDRLNLASKMKERLFQSAAPVYENIIALLDSEGKRILTTRETPTERSNFFLRDLQAEKDKQLTQLTTFPHPTPQLAGVQKAQIRYKRADGVDLTATLLLPPSYDAKRDGPLPMLMWAYPQEFTTANAASQVTSSPYRFNAISYWGPQAMLAMGYAVLDNPSMPIVGADGKEPNDTYLPQLIASAEAAIDEVVKRGVADRDRIAIGGHSYGAFMTGNLLAHTRLFRAGIARSGAYNRTLTPFGFQAEERPYWKAKDVYNNMSPFNYAENIKDALLMIHGEQDNNPGTFPIQSERLFQAIKGLGGTARLVMLPNESHGYRARESISHMLYETNLWMERYVKSAEKK